MVLGLDRGGMCRCGIALFRVAAAKRERHHRLSARGREQVTSVYLETRCGGIELEDAARLPGARRSPTSSTAATCNNAEAGSASPRACTMCGKGHGRSGQNRDYVIEETWVRALEALGYREEAICICSPTV